MDLNKAEIEKIDNAETIRVGVTGDLPPIDYVDEAGIPAGFNTAVLAEISRRIVKNIELVSIESGARSIALSEYSGAVAANRIRAFLIHFPRTGKWMRR